MFHSMRQSFNDKPVDSTGYAPVDSSKQEIRLLEVLPCPSRTPNQPVSCRLLHTRLNRWNTTAYEAISYVWGDASVKGTFLLDECPREAPQSAIQVLRKFRLPESSRILWIDAICIDQANTKERSEQVAMMGDVYSKCLRTLVWLGPADSNTSQDVESFHIVLNDLYRRPDWKRAWKGTTDGRRYFNADFNDLGDEATQRRHTNQALRLLSRPWFSRLWIFQECALAPESKAHCGSYEFNLLDLFRCGIWLFLKHFPARPLYDIEPLQSIMGMWAWVDPLANNSKRSSISLAYLRHVLRLSSIMKSTDPRDKVFAILGLFTHHIPRCPPDRVQPDIALLDVDYTKSVEDVHRDATRFVVLYGASLNILGTIRHTSTSIQSSKVSWTADLDICHDIDRECRPLPWKGRRGASDFSAAKDLQQARNRPFISDGRVLLLDGFEVGKVTETTETFQQHDTRFPAIDDQDGVMKHAEALYASLEAQNKVPFAAVIVGECAEQHREAVSHICQRSHRSNFLNNVSRETRDLVMAGMEMQEAISLIMEDSAGHVPHGIGYDLDMQWYTVGRRVFTTSSGHIGLGPSALRPGDKICVLRWGSWPFVLREAGEHHYLVGHCYLAGIMSGEAVALHNRMKKSSEWYKLI